MTILWSAGLLHVESSVRSIGMEPGLGFAACILAKWLASNDDPSKGVKSPGCLSDPLQACSCLVNQSETLNWLPPARRSRRVIVIAFRPDPEHVEGTTTKELLFEATIHPRLFPHQPL